MVTPITEQNLPRSFMHTSMAFKSIFKDPKVALIYLHLGERLKDLSECVERLSFDTENKLISDWVTAFKSYYELLDVFADKPDLLKLRRYREFTSIDKNVCASLTEEDIDRYSGLRACASLWRSSGGGALPSRWWSYYESSPKSMIETIQNAVHTCMNINYKQLNENLEWLDIVGVGKDFQGKVRKLLDNSYAQPANEELVAWWNEADISEEYERIFLFELAKLQVRYPVVTATEIPDLNLVFNPTKNLERCINIAFDKDGNPTIYELFGKIRCEMLNLGDITNMHPSWLDDYHSVHQVRPYRVVDDEEFYQQKALKQDPKIIAAFHHGDGRVLYMTDLEQLAK